MLDTTEKVFCNWQNGVQYLINSGCKLHNQIFNLVWLPEGYHEADGTFIEESDEKLIVNRILEHMDNKTDFLFRVYIFDLGCDIRYSSQHDFQYLSVDWPTYRLLNYSNEFVTRFFDMLFGFAVAAGCVCLIASRNMPLTASHIAKTVPRPTILNLGSNIDHGIQWIAVNSDIGGMCPIGVHSSDPIRLRNGFDCYPVLSSCTYLGTKID